MTTEFGNAGDSSENNKDGTNFGQTPGEINTGNTDDQGISQNDLEALQIRDAAAQLHIPTLESENEDLRNKLLEAEDKLTSATTIDEALDRISNNSNKEQVPGLDSGAVTQIVDQVLTQKQTEATSDSNWDKVQAKLVGTYGDWKTADTKVQERAAELDIELSDASAMARNNPKAFLQLFDIAGTTNTDSSAGTRSGGSGQTSGGIDSTTSGREQLETHYSTMRKEKPGLYWKTETQLQMRRDLYSQ